jgi:hypothetical protein
MPLYSASNLNAANNNYVVNTVARVTLAAIFNLPTSAAIVPLDTVTFDPGSHFNTTTHLYTCPIAGYYRVSATFFTYGPNGAVEILFAKNGATLDAGYQIQTASGTMAPQVNGVVQCNAGDTLAMWGTSSSAGSFSLSSVNLTVALIAPLTNAPVSPNTGARAYRNGALSIPASNGWTKIPLDTIATGNDPGGHFSTVTGRYTVTSAGWYQVNGSVNVLPTTAGREFTVVVYKNGALTTGGTGGGSVAGGSLNIQDSVSDIIYCVAGDYLELYFYVGDTSSVSLAVGPANVYLSVVKVDQPSISANTGWFTPTLSSPWTANVTPQYMKDANGFVHIRGSAAGGSSAQATTTIFTLPIGYRPGISDFYIALGTSGSAGHFLYITTAGLVQGTTTVGGDVLFFNGVANFLAEN